MQGQQTQRFLYAALPGVGGGNNMSYGGAGILVFDIDHGHKFVKRVPMPTALPLPPSTNGRPVSPQEAIKGIAAHAPTGRLYVSTNRRVAAFDLLTDKLVWEQRYEERGTDRIALSPDGTTLYAPELGAPKWVVADATTGALIATIDKPGNPHNTQYSDDGTPRVFRGGGQHADDVGRRREDADDRQGDRTVRQHGAPVHLQRQADAAVRQHQRLPRLRDRRSQDRRRSCTTSPCRA